MKGTEAHVFSFGDFVWWIGVVENRFDPKEIGRLQVRIFGYHTKDRSLIKTDQLMWASVLQPITSAAISGIGTSPTGIVEGTHVYGFFVDGHNAQVPVVFGTSGAIPSAKNPQEGFFDPTGTYPRDLNVPDTNRLAINKEISKTIVQKKRDDIDEATIAFGGTWKEPATKYNAKYPYNHVRETESGHIEEFDDTKGAERYQLYHRKGTFREIDPEGTQVEKIVKDNYSIVYGNDFVHVKGNVKITVDGNASLLVKGNADVEINGNLRQHVHGNYDLKVDGNFDMLTKGHQYEESQTHTKLKAPRIDLNL